MRPSVLLPLLAWCCAACHDSLDPTEAAPNAVPVAVSPEYRRWWVELENCAGVAATLRVQFYVVPEHERLIDPRTGREAEGLWIGHGGGPGTGDILVRARSEHRGALVKHEMLHAILYSGEHDDPVWRLGDSCGFDGRP
jgi:hypothetical protein